VLLASGAAVARLAGPKSFWLVPLGIVLTTYPHFLIAWHQSGVEVDRHAFEAALLLRLAGFLLALFVLDRALVAMSRVLAALRADVAREASG